MSDSDDENTVKSPYFVPFNKKTTHWGDPAHRPHISNVAYVLSPNLQGISLKMALLRMQIEENAYQIEHIEDEATYAIWKENFIDAKSWYNQIPMAVKERAREILSREIKSTISSFDQEFQSILKRPTHPSFYNNYHLYNPIKHSAINSSDSAKSSAFSFHISDANELSNNQAKNDDQINEKDEMKVKKKSIFDDIDLLDDENKAKEDNSISSNDSAINKLEINNNGNDAQVEESNINIILNDPSINNENSYTKDSNEEKLDTSEK